MRVPVISKDNVPLMPTKPSRARRWVKQGKAIGKFDKLGIYYIQLLIEPSDTKTQEVVIGLDPGKMYSGIAVQTKKYTLQMLHLVLPFKTVKDRMQQRAMMRRNRRGRRINRKVAFNKRATSHGYSWIGNVTITPSRFVVVRRPPISKRQLHLMTFCKGGNRRKYGGTVTRHGFRKGDYVKATQGKKIFYGWVSGDTEKQISVSDSDWKRLGQCSINKVKLIKRSTGLIVKAVKTACVASHESAEALSFPHTRRFFMSDRIDINRAYEILGLLPSASQEEIKRTYRKLIRTWHPDNFTDPVKKLEAEEKTKIINAAYKTLKSNIPNNQPSHSETAPQPNSTSVNTHSKASSAERFYQSGVEKVQLNKYEDAISDFSQAIRLNPYYIEAYKYRGLVCSQLGLELRATADLTKAMELERRLHGKNTKPPAKPSSYRSRQYYKKPKPLTERVCQAFKNLFRLKQG